MAEKTLQQLIAQNTITMVNFNLIEMANQFTIDQHDFNNYKLVINLSGYPTNEWRNEFVNQTKDFNFPSNVSFHIEPDNVGKNFIINNTNIQDFGSYKTELKNLFAKVNTDVVTMITNNFNNENFENQKQALLNILASYVI